jgi:hypothetical protein
MKITVKSLISHSGINATLVRSTIKQIGGFDTFKQYASDIANNGAAAGWCGFTYYTDTVSFTKRNKKHILEMLKEQAASFGDDNPLSFVASFQCLKNEDINEIADGMYNPRSDNQTTIYNALAWYVLEEISRAYSDLQYEHENN